MLSAIKEGIAKRLNEAAALLNLNDLPHHDYPSLVARVMQLELQQEVAVLNAMLETEDFEMQFKQRCQWRASHPESTVNFDELPESVTNQLYWDIAHFVFEPKTMGEMFSILMPNVTTCLEVALPELNPELITPAAIKNNFHNAFPVLKKTAVTSLTLAPAADLLTHYIVTGSLLFNINDISHFSLKIHTWFRDYISVISSSLAKKIYNHNAKIQSLVTHMQIYTNIGLTPRAALEQLIQWLILGGSRYTASTVASLSSVDAIKNFFAYFNALPATTQTELRSLKGGLKTLGEVIDVDIEKGRCVETTADSLKKIIELNKNNPALNSTPQMRPADLKKLERQYGFKAPLDTQRNEAPIINLPTSLLKKAVENLSPQNAEEFIFLLINFPTQFYDLLWEHIRVNSAQMNNLANLIMKGYFSAEQKQALAKAISKHYSRFEFHQPRLVWAILTNDIIFVEEALSSYDDKVKAISESYNGYPILHYIDNNEHIFKILLSEIPAIERSALLKAGSSHGRNILQKNAEHSATLTILLKLLPKDHITDAILASRTHGYNLFWHLAQFPNSLRAVLNILEPDQKLLLINHAKSILYYSNTHPECFTLILNLYEEKKFQVIMEPNEESDTVLHATATNNQNLEIALNSVPDQQKVASIKKVNKDGDTVLHKAVSNPKSLRVLLQAFPEEERYDVIKLTNKLDESVLTTAKRNSIKTIIELLPVRHRRNALLTKVGLTSVICRAIFEYGAISITTLIEISKLLSPEHYFDILFSDYNHGTILNYILRTSDNLKKVLRLLPLNLRQKAIKLLNYHSYCKSYFNWVIYTQDPELLEEIFNHFSEDQRLEAIKEIDPVGNTQLRNIVAEPGLLKILIKYFPDYLKLSDANSKKETVLDYFANKPESINILLGTLSGPQRLEAIKRKDAKGDTILHKADDLQIPIKTLLDHFPEQERLEIIQIKNTSQESLLSRSANNFESIQQLLVQLPAAQRVNAVLTPDKEGNCVLSHYVNSPEQLRTILLLLPQYQPTPPDKPGDPCEDLILLLPLIPENQKIALLKLTIANKPMLQILREQRISIIRTAPDFQNSFVPDLLDIYGILIQRASAQPGSMSFFKTNKSANAFLEILFAEDDIEIFKGKLIEYFNKNANGPLTIELLTKLVPGSYNIEAKVEQLKQRWGVSERTAALIPT